VNENFLEIDERRTRFFRAGNGTQKLIILHGWDADIDLQKSFGELISAWKIAGFLEKFEVILPYFPGFGGSEPPPPSGWGTHDFSNWLEKFLKKIAVKNCVFLAHSFGGRVLVRFLLKNPDFSKKSILVASAGIKFPLSARQKFSIFLSKKFVRAKSLIPQKIQKFVISRVFGGRDWSVAPEHLRSTLKKVLAEEDFREKLPQISTKILCLWGSEDSCTPLLAGRIFAKKLQRGRLKILTGGRHGIHRTNPEWVADRVREFLIEK